MAPKTVPSACLNITGKERTLNLKGTLDPLTEVLDPIEAFKQIGTASRSVDQSRFGRQSGEQSGHQIDKSRHWIRREFVLR